MVFRKSKFGEMSKRVKIGGIIVVVIVIVIVIYLFIRIIINKKTGDAIIKRDALYIKNNNIEHDKQEQEARDKTEKENAPRELLRKKYLDLNKEALALSEINFVNQRNLAIVLKNIDDIEKIALDIQTKINSTKNLNDIDKLKILQNNNNNNLKFQKDSLEIQKNLAQISENNLAIKRKDTNSANIELDEYDKLHKK